jgi:glycylpeptide N-tetradecanoyltransferase
MHRIKHCAEINFLCVHKKLRGKRLAPVLIKEVTRRCHLVGIFQAVYTGGIFIPTPVARCQYYHRIINTKKLVEVGFTRVPPGLTLGRLMARNKLPDGLALPGFRELEERDLEQVSSLLRRYLARGDLVPMWTDDELRHNIFAGRGEGESIEGRRKGQVIWSYVVEVRP